MTAVAPPRYPLRVVVNDRIPESRRLHVGALGLHCLVWGRPGDPVAVLVHGNGGHAHWWDALVPALVPGWRLIALDLRGHGESDWSEPPSYRLDDFTADLMAVLDQLAPGPVVFVGHSMGGRIVAACAVRFPQRVRKLALLDTRMSGINVKVAQKWRGRMERKRHGRGYPTRAAALAAFRLVPDEPHVDADLLAQLAHYAVHERGPGDWTFRFDRAVLALDGDGGGELYGMLGRIRCPTFIMHGSASWVMDTAEAAALQAAIPDCRVRAFPGAHHFLLAQPQAVGVALRQFLDAAHPTERKETDR